MVGLAALGPPYGLVHMMPSNQPGRPVHMPILIVKTNQI